MTVRGSLTILAALSRSRFGPERMPSGSRLKEHEPAEPCVSAIMRKLLFYFVSGALAVAAGCSGVSEPDTTPPAVVSTNPPDQFDSAPVYDSVAAVFSETINPNSVDSAALTLTNTVSEETVKGAVIGRQKSIAFVPAEDLDYSTPYTATVKAGIRDLAGNAMVSDYSWSFTTEVYHPGIRWRPREAGTSNFLYGVDCSDGRFVAAGYLGTIVSSSDGIDWEPVSSSAGKTILDVLWTGDQFVAVGNNVIMRSPDGLSWTEVKAISTDDPFGLEGVAYSGSKLVAVDRYGQVFSSADDGESWIRELDTASGRAFWEITWSESMFVAIGGSGYAAMVATSADGSEWSFRNLDILGELFDVTWTGSQLIAVGGKTTPVDGATIVTSHDGITWTERPVPIIDPLFAVWPAGTTIVAVGLEGTILTSETGIVWTERESGSESALYGITSSDDRVVVVGTHGTILTSP